MFNLFFYINLNVSFRKGGGGGGEGRGVSEKRQKDVIKDKIDL